MNASKIRSAVCALIAVASVGCAPGGAETGEAVSGINLATLLNLPYGGVVNVAVLPFVSTAGGSFFRANDRSDCRVRRAGTCVLTDCGSGRPTVRDGHAGSITISGGAAPVVINPGADDGYSWQSGFTIPPAAPYFAPGASIDIAASGGTAVGAFFVRGLRVPTRLTNGLPKNADGSLAPVTIDRARDFDVRWSDTDAGSVEFNLSQSDGRFQPGGAGPAFVATRSVTVSCLFAAAPGRGQVPASLLRDFAPGASTPITVDVLNGAADARLANLSINPQSRLAVVVRAPSGGHRVIDAVVQRPLRDGQTQSLSFR